jgi:hypothetical protein
MDVKGDVEVLEEKKEVNVEWKGAVDSLKVGFLNSEGIKKEGRTPPAFRTPCALLRL